MSCAKKKAEPSTRCAMNNKRKSLYESWLRRIDEAHKCQQTAWEEAKTAKLADWELNSKTMPSEKHWEVNGFAYEAARMHAQTRNDLMFQLFEALPFQEMANGDSEAIDHILDFAEIDIPAFRCGYAKEWCYRRLKRMTLTEVQQQRLLNLTLQLCQNSGWRRELSDLAKLVSAFANADFMKKLRLLEKSESKYVRAKALCAISKILVKRDGIEP